LWAFGETTWAVYEVVLDQAAPFPSFADALYLVAYPAIFVAVLILVAPARRIAWLRTGLDATAVTLALTTPIWLYVLKPIGSDSGADVLTTALALAYPAGDLLVVFAVSLAILRPNGGRPSPFFAVLGLGLIAFVASDLAFAYLSLNDEFGTGTILDLGWMAGYLLLAIAAYLGRREGALIPATDSALRSPANRQSVPLLVLGVLVAWCLYETQWGRGIDLVVVLGVIAVTGLVVARNYLTTNDILRVTDELEETRALLESANAGLLDKSRTLNVLLTEAVDLSRRDSMTGLFNHAAILEELETSIRNGAPVLVVLLDVDHMKTINDELGHQVGDEVLKGLASAIRSQKGLVGGRYGGDEFLAIARLQDEAETAIESIGSALSLISAGGHIATVTIGWASYPADGQTADQLVATADERLYERKRARSIWRATPRTA
jgi:diguanylate cyclase (GGDEF)-like protein